MKSADEIADKMISAKAETRNTRSANQMGWRQLKKAFGFSDHGDVGDNFNIDMMGDSEEKGDGTFQLGDSGKAYLTKDDWEKNRNSDKTWDLYAKHYGQDAMQSKREGNEDGLSASAFDGLMDKVYAGKAKTDDKPEAPVQLSKTAAEAEALVDTWNADMVRGGGLTEMIYGFNPVDGHEGYDRNPAGDWSANYKDTVKQYLQPGGWSQSGHPSTETGSETEMALADESLKLKRDEPSWIARKVKKDRHG